MLHRLFVLSIGGSVRLASMLLLIAGLAGCASTWMVDSDVNTFSKLSRVPAGAGYRFERLPSQQAAEQQQSRLEAMADAALQHVGLRRDDAQPAYSAQISARVTAAIAPWDDPWFSPGWAPHSPFGYGPGYRPGFYGPVFPPNPWYLREVSVVLRELPSGQVVYETSARNDGPYPASGAILPILFDAALQGFPNPPAGARQVRIAIPPTPAKP